jgi:hypothetical protein
LAMARAASVAPRLRAGAPTPAAGPPAGAGAVRAGRRHEPLQAAGPAARWAARPCPCLVPAWTRCAAALRPARLRRVGPSTSSPPPLPPRAPPP